MGAGGRNDMTSTTVDKSRLRSVVDAFPADDLTDMRRDAVETFATQGFPTANQEDWKYTSLGDIAALSNEWLESANIQLTDAATDEQGPEVALTESIDVEWVVIRDGVVATGLPEIDGVEIDQISEDDLKEFPADDAMTAFNTALLRDGIRIRTRRSARPQRAIGILYSDNPSNAVVQTRVVVDVAESSTLQLIEVCTSSGPGRQFTNSILDTRLKQEAKLDHVRLQNRQDEHSGVNRFRSLLAQNAVLHHNSFDFGGALSRNDVVAEIAGTGANVRLNGLYLSSGRQHIDNHTSIIHGVGPSQSEEEYRGILGGRSQCVFNGKVFVAEGADGSDSSQSNHNLLLSERAEIDTKPELEIYADDVKCAHGATVGQLDRSALFYLRSRGFSEGQARKILTRAFAEGTLSSLSIDACREFVATALDRKLSQLVDERNE